MIALNEALWGVAPTLRLGQKVWVVLCKDEVVATEVLGIHLTAIKGNLKNEGEVLIYCTGYKLGTTNIQTGDSTFFPRDIYRTAEEAHKNAKWHPISGFSEEEWDLAIGNRDNEDSIESCELSPCCADISRIRDILLEAKKEGGLIGRDLEELRCLLEEHGKIEGEILARILAQLDFNWKR